MRYLLCVVGWLAGAALMRAFPHRSLLALVGALLVVASSAGLVVLLFAQIARWLGSRRSAIWGLVGVVIFALVALFVAHRLGARSEEAEIEQTIQAV
jgi:hypothetical protein